VGGKFRRYVVADAHSVQIGSLARVFQLIMLRNTDQDAHDTKQKQESAGGPE